MPHYHLQSFENKWTLVRETSSSQKFTIETPEGHTLSLDVHYTKPKLLTVSAVFKGEKQVLSKAILSSIFDELGRLALKHGDYAVIDYTLAHSDDIFEGNFSINEMDRKSRSL